MFWILRQIGKAILDGVATFNSIVIWCIRHLTLYGILTCIIIAIVFTKQGEYKFSLLFLVMSLLCVFINSKT